MADGNVFAVLAGGAVPVASTRLSKRSLKREKQRQRDFKELAELCEASVNARAIEDAAHTGAWRTGEEFARAVRRLRGEERHSILPDYQRRVRDTETQEAAAAVAWAADSAEVVAAPPVSTRTPAEKPRQRRSTRRWHPSDAYATEEDQDEFHRGGGLSSDDDDCNVDDDVDDDDGGASLDSRLPRHVVETHGGQAFSFSVLSYNILAQRYARYAWFRHVTKKALAWNWRKYNLLLELYRLGADVMCLQEVDRFSEWWQPELTKIGFSSVYKKRVGAHRRDGSLVAWRTSKFTRVAHHWIDFNELASVPGLEPSNASATDRQGNRFLRDNVAVMVMLRVLDPSSMTLGDDVVNVPVYVCVVSAHLFWDPAYEDVKVRQAELLLRRTNEFVASLCAADPAFPRDPSTIPVVVAGDFNARLNGAVFQYMTQGCGSDAAVAAAAAESDVPLTYPWPKTPLASAYAAYRPLVVEQDELKQLQQRVDARKKKGVAASDPPPFFADAYMNSGTMYYPPTASVFGVDRNMMSPMRATAPASRLPSAALDAAAAAQEDEDDEEEDESMELEPEQLEADIAMDVDSLAASLAAEQLGGAEDGELIDEDDEDDGEDCGGDCGGDDHSGDDHGGDDVSDDAASGAAAADSADSAAGPVSHDQHASVQDAVDDSGALSYLFSLMLPLVVLLRWLGVLATPLSRDHAACATKGGTGSSSNNSNSSKAFKTSKNKKSNSAKKKKKQKNQANKTTKKDEETSRAAVAPAAKPIFNIQARDELCVVPPVQVDADGRGHPPFTNFVPHFKGCLDYLFHSRNIVPTALLDVVPARTLLILDGLPTLRWSSDHLAIMAQFVVQPQHCIGNLDAVRVHPRDHDA